MTPQTEVKAALHTTKRIAIKCRGDGHGANTWAKWKSSKSIKQFSFLIHLQLNWSRIPIRPFLPASTQKGNTMLILLGWAEGVAQSGWMHRKESCLSILSIREHFLLLTPAWQMKSPDTHTHAAAAFTFCLHWHQPCYKPSWPFPLLPFPTLIFSVLNRRQFKERLIEAGVTIQW